MLNALPDNTDVSLRLAALDSEDLAIISAHMQDALLQLADMCYLAKTRQFAFVSNRFAWERQPETQRRRSGLHFENVLKVQHLGLNHLAPSDILSLLSITFEPGDEPAGHIVLTFSAARSIRLEVEYIDARLKDLGGAWETQNIPRHDAPQTS